MKVVIAGGGTGGHLFPGIAVAEELKARGHQVTFVGTARGIEARVCPQEGWPLELIDVAGLKGGGALGILKGLFRIPRAFFQSISILRRIAPDLVIGVGGYASGPMVMAAALTGYPTAILEQNSVPGITNRILGRVVRAVFGAFDAAKKHFPAAKYRLVGNPVRKRVRDSLTGGAEGEALLVVGGSQGAHAVNELVADAMILLKAEGMAPRLVHQTGNADLVVMQKKYMEAAIEADVRAFIDDMATAYRGCALAVTRAGASTLAELTALGVPAILIPFPFAADDHQTVNARELEEKGAARLLVQKQTSAKELASAIRELLRDDVARKRMAEAARKLGRPDAHAQICDALEALVAPRTLPAVAP
jgi:UDP-N-acetylglucosamine--N-acetylmuramyl-(pentapeptide) pyrophosphoryl-undecaprenol N-acetylglucosamine transferase